MAKKRFLKPVKQVKKEIGTRFLNSAVSGGGFLVAKGVGNKISEKIENEKTKRVLGPAMFLLGTIGEAFIDQPQAAAACRGIAIHGVERSFDDFVPVDLKSKMGLGAANSASKTSNGKEIDAGKGFDWEEAAQKAQEELDAEEEARRAAQKEGVDGLGNKDPENVDEVNNADEVAEAFNN